MLIRKRTAEISIAVDPVAELLHLLEECFEALSISRASLFDVMGVASSQAVESVISSTFLYDGDARVLIERVQCEAFVGRVAEAEDVLDELTGPLCLRSLDEHVVFALNEPVDLG